MNGAVESMVGSSGYIADYVFPDSTFSYCTFSYCTVHFLSIGKIGRHMAPFIAMTLLYRVDFLRSQLS